MIRNSLKVLLIQSLAFWGTAWSANFEVTYLDGPNEGFNSNGEPHTESREDGNPGETLGDQRRWAFEKALEFWELRLSSPVTITIDAEMTNDTNVLDCNSNSATLGFAGPNSAVFFNSGSSPHPIAETYYPIATANRLTSSDIDPEKSDIGSNFNSRIDASDNCLGNNVWYYALGNAPAGTVSFFKTVLHEVAHGLGFLTLADIETGELFMGKPDIYSRRLEDHSIDKHWSDDSMTIPERQDSATDENDLHWTGPDVIESISSLASGTSGGHVEMYAPTELKKGSSVSHWDTDVDGLDGNSELMEPSATGTEKLVVTDELLSDIGWNTVEANNCTFGSDRLTQSSILTGTNSHNACVSVTYDGANVDSGETNAFAGQQIIIKNGFRVKESAVFSAQTDPGIGL